MGAVGLIEVFGLTAALVAADAACKAANVKIEALDNNKPKNADELEVPVLIVVKFSGTVSDVNMAMEAAINASNKISGVHSKYIMSHPDEGIKKFIKISCIK